MVLAQEATASVEKFYSVKLPGENEVYDLHLPGEEPPGPAPPASNLQILRKQLAKVERERYELQCQAEVEKAELEAKEEKLLREREEIAEAHAKEILEMKEQAERQVRDAVNKLRREVFLCEDTRKKAEGEAFEHLEFRDAAEERARELERQITALQVESAQKEALAQDEITRVKAERDASYQRTQEHAEERVKAMCTVAREAHQTMYKNMHVLETERKRLTLSANVFSPTNAAAYKFDPFGASSGTGSMSMASILKDAGQGGRMPVVRMGTRISE